MEVLYKDRETDIAYSKNQLPEIMLRELMIEKLGFTSWNMHEHILEQSHYKKVSVSVSTRSSENGQSMHKEENKKPWWKFW